MRHESEQRRDSVRRRLLRELRQAKGWTQETLGQKAGFHHKQISKFERGTVRLEQHQLAFLCLALGITVEAFEDRVSERLREDRTFPLGPPPITVAAAEFQTITEALEAVMEHYQHRRYEAGVTEAETVAKRWPHLARSLDAMLQEAVGRSYVGLGRAVEAAELLRQARDGYLNRFFQMHLHLIDAYRQAALEASPGSAEARELYEKAKVEQEGALAYSRYGEMAPLQTGEFYKVCAEILLEQEFGDWDGWLNRQTGGMIVSQIYDYLERARMDNRRAALDLEEEGLGGDRALYEAAHAWLNVGYCEWLLSTPQRNPLWPYTWSLDLRLKRMREKPYRIGYALRMMALAYRDQRAWPLAGWCAQAAALLYLKDGCDPGVPQRLLQDLLMRAPQQAASLLPHLPAQDQVSGSVLGEQYRSLPGVSWDEIVAHRHAERE